MRSLLRKISMCQMLLFACALGFLPQILQSQPLTQTGVRVDAMGGAFLAVSNDVNALQFSPAGLLNNKEKWFAEAGHHLMFVGIDGLGLTQLSFARNYSTRRKGQQVLVPRFVDAGATVLAAPGPASAEDTLLQRYSLGFQAQFQNFPGYNQNALRATVAYGFGARLNDAHMMEYDESTRQAPFAFSVGLSARYLWIGLDRAFLEDGSAVNDPGELSVIKNFLGTNSASSKDWALDASVTYYFSRKLQAAFSVMNLKQPNLAAKLGEGGKSPDGLFARRYRCGVAYRVFERWLAAVDAEKNPQAAGWFDDYNVYVGAEYEGIKYVTLRGGFNRNWIAVGASYAFMKHFRLHGA
ncbi:MAG: hypothetical protein AAB354_03575, partial [candidate division KSB1 bacterium]